jgi:hypothetical protein
MVSALSISLSISIIMVSRVLAIPSSNILSTRDGTYGGWIAHHVLVAFAVTSTLIVGAVVVVVVAGKPSSTQQKKKRRNLFQFLRSWWRRRQQGYIRQDDTAEESVMTEVHSYYPPPAFGLLSQDSFVEQQQEPSIASKTMYYEHTPMLPPRYDDESLVSEITYIPPSPHPAKVAPESPPPPSSSASKSCTTPTRKTRRLWNDYSSFQSSLESLDSLVESYWDPSDDCSQQMSFDMEPSAVMKEHLEFLRQQRCRDDHVGIRNKLTWSDE